MPLDGIPQGEQEGEIAPELVREGTRKESLPEDKGFVRWDGRKVVLSQVSGGRLVPE